MITTDLSMPPGHSTSHNSTSPNNNLAKQGVCDLMPQKTHLTCGPNLHGSSPSNPTREALPQANFRQDSKFLQTASCAAPRPTPPSTSLNTASGRVLGPWGEKHTAVTNSRQSMSPAGSVKINANTRCYHKPAVSYTKQGTSPQLIHGRSHTTYITSSLGQDPRHPATR